MTYYDDIFDEAADNYGLITTARAKEMGIAKEELAKLTARGKLTRIGWGVYRIKHHVPSPLDVYADAVALVGPSACIADESVLAMHGLASVNPDSITVGTSKRVRKDLPEYVRVVPIAADARITVYDGIPSMPIADAIRRCKTKIMPERLQEAIRDGVDKGVISRREEPLLEEEIG